MILKNVIMTSIISCCLIGSFAKAGTLRVNPATQFVVTDLNVSQQGLNTIIYATLTDGVNQGIRFSIAADDDTTISIATGLKQGLADDFRVTKNKYAYIMTHAPGSNVITKIQEVPLSEVENK